MAYILKAGKTYTLPYDGTLSTTVYGIVEDLGLNKQRKQMRFDLVIYASRAARVSLLQPLASYTVVVNEPEFSTYFGASLTTNIWVQIQTYLVAVGLPPPLVVSDWKVDPQAEP